MLKKARDYRKKNISEETETERQIRIEKMKAYCAVKKLTQTEFERKAHLEKKKGSNLSNNFQRKLNMKGN